MKNIRSLADTEVLNETNVPEKVIEHICDYFKWMTKLYGYDYNPLEFGWVILLEKNDPLTDIAFLEKDLGINGSRTLVSIEKEFVDYRVDTNFFEVFARYNDEFGMIFLIPNEDYIGQELLSHLRTFKNDSGNSSYQGASIFN